MSGARGLDCSRSMAGSHRPVPWELVPATGPVELLGLAWLAEHVAVALVAEALALSVPLVMGYYEGAFAARWRGMDLEALSAAARRGSWLLAVGVLCVLQYVTMGRSKELVVDDEWFVLLGRGGREWELHIPSISVLRLERVPPVAGGLLSYVDISLETPEGARSFRGILRRSRQLVRELTTRAGLIEVAPGEHRPSVVRATDREAPAERAARLANRALVPPPSGRLARQARSVLWGTGLVLATFAFSIVYTLLSA